ncbi:MAG: HEAT repeat domain-containing protein [Ignavibacteriales bacterium]|nr:HEAT repeat domain-containing protein [Ignavibacteriales bacterium]
MKKRGTIFGVIVLAITMALPATAHEMRKDVGEAKYDQAVKNLLVGVSDEINNTGLRRSAIYMLGQLEAKEAVIPLMKVLHSCPDERSRMAAAWALCQIGDGRGEYAVKQAVRFDENAKVKMHCAWYYNLYVNDGTFAFYPSANAPTQIAELQ